MQNVTNMKSLLQGVFCKGEMPNGLENDMLAYIDIEIHVLKQLYIMIIETD